MVIAKSEFLLCEVGGDGVEWEGGAEGKEEGLMVLGEGVDKGILQDVVGIASVKEIRFKLEGVAEEVGTMGADPTDT